MAKSRLIAAALAAWFGLAQTVHAQNDAPPLVPAAPSPMASDAPYVRPRVWQVQIDPFLMWYPGSRYPALLTTGQPNVDPASMAIPGALGDPSTQVLVGGKAMGDGSVGGVRFTLAYAFGEVGSIDVGGFLTQSRTLTFVRASDPNGSPILARPFLDANFDQETVDQYRSYPDYFVGTTRDTFASRLYGAEGNVRWDVVPTSPANRVGFNVLVGVRYFQLNESYSSFDTSVDLPVGTGFSSQFSDTFETNNSFFGGQIGATLKVRFTRVSIDVTGKLIGGNNSQSVDISGFSTLTDPNGISATDHNLGLYAQPSNIGRYTRDALSIGGELGLKFGYQFTDYFRLNVGYTLFTMGNVVRPGEQIDRVVNIQPMFGNGVIGVARPAFLGRESVFTTQMLNLGCEFLF